MPALEQQQRPNTGKLGIDIGLDEVYKSAPSYTHPAPWVPLHASLRGAAPALSFKERLSRPLATASAGDAGALDWPFGAAVSFFCCLAAARVFSRLAFLASALLLAAGAAGMVMSQSRRHAATQ